jgi:hypothetical protein
LRLEFIEFTLWKRFYADNHFLYGGSDKHKLRHKQHTELGGSRSDDYRHRAGYIHVQIGKRFNQHEPNRDNHLHADSRQRCWFDHLNADRHRKPAKQTSHQLFHRQPHKHYLRFQQHVELDDERGEQHCHHAGNIYIRIREWFDQRQPNRDDHLHADCDQCLGLSNIHGESHSNSVRQSIGDNNHFVPRRNTRRGVRRLHDSRQRWLSALRLFRKLEFQLLSVT